MRQTCAPLNGQKQFKEVEQQTARLARLARLTRLDGSATLTECPMDGGLDPVAVCPSPRHHSVRCPVANHNSIVSTCHLQDMGAAFRQRPSIIQSRWHLPIFPAITPQHCRPFTAPRSLPLSFSRPNKTVNGLQVETSVWGAPRLRAPLIFQALYQF